MLFRSMKSLVNAVQSKPELLEALRRGVYQMAGEQFGEKSINAFLDAANKRSLSFLFSPEQLTNLRTTPGLSVWRPCDKVETVAAWRSALERKGPSALVFSRQGLPHQERSTEQLGNISKGAYILEDCDGEPSVILLASGSEVNICREAAKQLQADGIQVRLVSIPSTDVFAAQDAEYQEAVLPSAVRHRLAVEAGHGDYWYRWVGLDGDVISLNRFGASGPGGEVMAHFGFTADNVAERAKALLG